MLSELIKELNSLKNLEQAKKLQKFFKTGKGQYGEGDIFLGVKVPAQRAVAKRYVYLELKDLQELLNSKIHEHRMVALLILVDKYKKSKKDLFRKREIFEFYLKNAERINNWDLVDLSAPTIVGDFIQVEGTYILRELANSGNLWKKRIAIVSTYPLIRQRRFGETLAISEVLLHDKHDLIHKAVGWMLREVGKRNREILEIFLSTRYKKMPRTMLRYAIEKFPEEERKKYLRGEV